MRWEAIPQTNNNFILNWPHVRIINPMALIVTLYIVQVNFTLVHCFPMLRNSNS